MHNYGLLIPTTPSSKLLWFFAFCSTLVNLSALIQSCVPCEASEAGGNDTIVTFHDTYCGGSVLIGCSIKDCYKNRRCVIQASNHVLLASNYLKTAHYIQQFSFLHLFLVFIINEPASFFSFQIFM